MESYGGCRESKEPWLTGVRNINWKPAEVTLERDREKLENEKRVCEREPVI